MTENMPEVDPEYAEVFEVVFGVPEAFTNFSMSDSYPRQTPMHNPYFSAVIMFVCALSFEEKDLHHLI
jgi:hypothetical protein